MSCSVFNYSMECCVEESNGPHFFCCRLIWPPLHSSTPSRAKKRQQQNIALASFTIILLQSGVLPVKYPSTVAVSQPSEELEHEQFNIPENTKNLYKWMRELFHEILARRNRYQFQNWRPDEPVFQARLVIASHADFRFQQKIEQNLQRRPRFLLPLESAPPPPLTGNLPSLSLSFLSVWQCKDWMSREGGGRWNQFQRHQKSLVCITYSCSMSWNLTCPVKSFLFLLSMENYNYPPQEVFSSFLLCASGKLR